MNLVKKYLFSNLALRKVDKWHKWSFMNSSQERIVSEGINSDLSGNG